MIEFIIDSSLHGAGLSFVTSFFSSVYYNKNIKITISESILCTTITLGLVGSLDFFSFPQPLSPAAGLGISLLGFEKVKKMTTFYLTKNLKEKVVIVKK
ncbi:phage holin family protein [Enterobacter asburiae]|nr:phage holin family protein [Enterobacter asburiae]